MTTSIDGFIRGQQRIREATARAVRRHWAALPGYDRADLPRWLELVVPTVTAGQRQSVALTNAYIATKLQRRPLGLQVDELIGSAVRGGVPLDAVWARPFVTHWTALKAGTPFAQANAAGLARAESMARFDVQASARSTAQAVQVADDTVVGWRRVADADCCDYCAAIDGAFVKSADAMPLHNGCGCGLEPVTGRPRTPTPTPETVAVHEHGELGPVLGDPSHDFTAL